MTPPTSSTAAVYVHFPWCLHRCAYCDFATTANLSPPTERYTDAVLSELSRRASQWRPAEVSTIFFGGGTPSLWGAKEIGRVIEGIDRWAPIASDAEISMEANPSSAGALDDFIAAGVNRVSVGVQATEDHRLRALDRVHDAATARATLSSLERLLASGQLRSASADLMFGAPEQDLADLRLDVSTLLDHGLPHISAYALTVEEGTPLAKQVARGLVQPPSDNLQAEMLELLPELMRPYGLDRYEVSNFARPGHECAHNLVYWRGGHYLALGVGSHGFTPMADAMGRRYGNLRSSSMWMTRIEQGELAEAFEERPTSEQHLDELLLTGLRLREGVTLSTVRARVGPALTTRLLRAAEGLIASGAPLWLTDEALGVAPAAWAHLDRHVVDLVHEL